MSQPQLPVANVSVSQEFVVPLPFQPDVSTKTALVVVFPVTVVLFVRVEPVHRPLAISHVVRPVSFKNVTTRISHLSISPLHSSFPVSLVEGAISILEDSIPVSESILPLPLINDAFFGIGIGSLAVSEAV